MATAPLTQTTGRRKEAVARVRLRTGSGKVVVNGKPIEVYFPTATQRMTALEALRVTNTESAYDIDITIDGGGVTGQAEAVRLGIARALVLFNPELKKTLKDLGMMTRDAREVERKKAGLKKARKAPQWAKR